MLYLATPNTVAVRQAIADGRLGAMLTPDSWKTLNWAAVRRFGDIGLDNGCFSNKWEESRWLDWLDRMAVLEDHVRFAVVPDRFNPDDLAGNHPATVERWYRYRHEVKDRGLPAAFVCQNGCTPDDIPPDVDAVFIGGDTAYKLSELAWACVAWSKAHARWVHVGRVNSQTRARACKLSGVDSIDGTYLKWPDTNLPKLLRFMQNIETPSLALLSERAA